jgi:hypothetical protein
MKRKDDNFLCLTREDEYAFHIGYDIGSFTFNFIKNNPELPNAAYLTESINKLQNLATQ